MFSVMAVYGDFKIESKDLFHCPTDGPAHGEVNAEREWEKGEGGSTLHRI
jgi:hypothetical protein